MRQRIVRAVKRPEFWLVCLFCWVLFSAGRSVGTPWARAALTEALRWDAGIGLALVIGTWLRRTQAAAQGVVVLAGLLALLGAWRGLQPERGGLTGPYQEHQLYGSVLLILLPLCVSVALASRDSLWRMGAVAASGAGFFCLLFSQSRSAWAGAFIAALVLGGLWSGQNLRDSQDRRMGIASAAVLLGGVLLLWLLTTPTNLRIPLTARVGTLSTLPADDSWQERTALWQGALRLAASHPLYGVGLGRYPSMQWEWTGKGRRLTPLDRPSLSEEAHEFYLQTAAEIGVIGLGLYGMALLTFVFQSIARLRQKPSPHRRDALIIAAFSMLAGQSVDALASPSWQFAEASLFFWALLGLGIASLSCRRAEADAVPASVLPKRIGHYALSGVVAVAITANVLPIGLLTPVEAYTPPTGTTFKSAVITGSTQNAKVGDVVSFKMIATYTDAQHTYTPNVSNEGTTAFVATISPGVTSYGTFTQDAANQRVLYTVPAGVNGKTLTISGHFQNGFITTQTTQTAALIISP